MVFHLHLSLDFVFWISEKQQQQKGGYRKFRNENVNNFTLYIFQMFG
jgi:hypothetical protein